METDPFRIRGHVPAFEAIQAGYARASDTARAAIRSERDLAYGPHPDERLDLFFPATAAGPCPVHLFVHGGYWRANRKEDYAFVAGPVVAAGAIAAIVEYALLPAVRMEVLVAQVRRAAAWLAAEAPRFGGDPERLTACGHSAGAHLASYLAAQAPHEPAPPALRPRALLLVSGIYDLAPITSSFLQPEIALTPEEVARWSPLGAEPVAGVRRVLAVGAVETPPFRAQTEAYARATGAEAPRLLPGLDHMTIVAEMGRSGSAMAALLAACALA